MLDKNHNCWCVGRFLVSFVGGGGTTEVLIGTNKFLFTEAAVMLCSDSPLPRKAFLFATSIYKLPPDIFLFRGVVTGTRLI